MFKVGAYTQAQQFIARVILCRNCQICAFLLDEMSDFT